MQDAKKTKYHSHHHGHKRKFRPWRWFWSILAVIFVMGAGYSFYLYHNLNRTVNKTFIPLKNQMANNAKISNQKPISILLMGTDTGAFGRTESRGRTDSMILVTLNPKKQQTTMTSIPRDTMAKMIGDEQFNVQKINAAYSIGGSEMAINSVTALLNVPINYYAVINMGGLKGLVDAVDGVNVDVPFNFKNSGYTFKKGNMHLYGDAALAYARMRYDDPKGDYGRQERQQQIIMGIMKAAPSLSTLANYEKIMAQIKDNFRSNISLKNMVTLYNNYKGAMVNIEQNQLKGTGAYIGGSSYQIAATSTLQRFSDELRTNLGLETTKLANEEVRQNRLNKDFDWTATNNPSFTIYQ